MVGNRAIINRFKRKREINRLKRQIIELETFIGNHGWYPGVRDDCKKLEAMKYELNEVIDNRTTEKKSPAEAKGDCTICKGWVNDGRGGTCIFADDFWAPCCPHDKETKQ